MSNKLLESLVVGTPDIQVINQDDCFYDALQILNKNKWGAVFIINENKKIAGIITDGDARKIIAANNEPIAQLNSEPAVKYANLNPTAFKISMPVIEALKVMNQKMFLCAPVVNDNGEFVGIVHMQHLVSELIKSGII